MSEWRDNQVANSIHEIKRHLKDIAKSLAKIAKAKKPKKRRRKK